MYVFVSIGNTDNKLTQQEWSEFVGDLEGVVVRFRTTLHFFGGASTWEPWQNVGALFEAPREDQMEMEKALVAISRKHNQESIFMMIGDPQFLK